MFTVTSIFCKNRRQFRTSDNTRKLTGDNEVYFRAFYCMSQPCFVSGMSWVWISVRRPRGSMSEVLFDVSQGKFRPQNRPNWLPDTAFFLRAIHSSCHLVSFGNNDSIIKQSTYKNSNIPNVGVRWRWVFYLQLWTGSSRPKALPVSIG